MTRRGIVSFVTITNGVYRPDARANGSRAAGPCRESSIRPAAFAPVGEPGRARIALVVREIGKGCVGDIAERLELKISLVFNHMRAFADHDLAEKRSVGKFVCLSRQSGGRRSWQECECASSDGSFRHAGRRASTGQSCSESSTGGRGTRGRVGASLSRRAGGWLPSRRRGRLTHDVEHSARDDRQPEGLAERRAPSDTKPTGALRIKSAADDAITLVAENVSQWLLDLVGARPALSRAPG